MKLYQIISKLEELAPLHYAEDFDNVGLLTGYPDMDVAGALVSLDVSEDVVEEAVRRRCNLIVSFHPIIFSGLKRLTGATYVERTVMKALKNDIAIYAIHTALDNAFYGTNASICDVLGLQGTEILIPKSRTLKKLAVYVPRPQAEMLCDALFMAGGGRLGNYDQCSFRVEGIGTFRGNEQSRPFAGVPTIFHREEETLVSMVYEPHREKAVLEALRKAHPYEEPAYEVTLLSNPHPYIGMGMLGTLPDEMEERAFLRFAKEKMNTAIIRHSALTGRPVKSVAVLGGSGSFAIEAAKARKADAFITADLKYHQFFQAEGQILLMDVGHYESEQFIKSKLKAFLDGKIPNFAVILSEINTNPVHYF